MGEALLPAALIAYFSGIFLALLGVGTRSRGAQRAGIVSLGIAWCLHLAAIVRLAILTGHFPLSSMGEYLLVLSWAVLSAYLLLSLRFRMQGAGVLLPFLAFLMGATALAAPVKEIAVPDSHQQAWFIVHTTLATLGMAALCVAFGMSLIYLLQDAALKSKRTPRLLEVLPSLEVCDRVGYAAVLWGFPLLTLGILTGALWSASKGGTVVLSMPRVAAIRAIMLNHWYHHRGQLGVYLRLLGANVPSSYGPSGDE